MKLRQIIPIFLILVPIIEIVLFVEIGSIIGSFYTILIIIISAFLGFYLIKHHTISYIAEIQNKLLQIGDLFINVHNACSLPPLPMTRTFINFLSWSYLMQLDLTLWDKFHVLFVVFY